MKKMLKKTLFHRGLSFSLIVGTILASPLCFAEDKCQSFLWKFDKNFKPLDSFFTWNQSYPVKLYSFPDFSSKPNFILNSEGFSNDNEPLCQWKHFKNFKKNSLVISIPPCEEYLDMYASAYIDTCPVIKLSHYSHNGERVVAKVKYNDREYFLDPSKNSVLLDPLKVSFKDYKENSLEKSWNMFSGWHSSCYGDWGIDRPSAIYTDASDYLFFSLSGLFRTPDRGDENKMRFFKDKDFSSQPEYVLDSEGLSKKDELICGWKYPYSESNISKNYLDCEKEAEQKLVQFFSLEGMSNFSPGSQCAVLVPKLIENINGFFRFKFQIGDSDYYLDTSEMPRVSDGYFLSTLEKRNKVTLEAEAKKKKRVKENLGTLKNNSELAKLKDCIKNQNAQCIAPYLGASFIQEVIRVSDLDDAESDPCRLNENSDDCMKLVSEESLAIVGRALQLVEIEELGSLEFNKGYGYKRFTITLEESLASGLDSEHIVIEIDDKGGLKLIDYNSGLGC